MQQQEQLISLDILLRRYFPERPAFKIPQVRHRIIASQVMKQEQSVTRDDVLVLLLQLFHDSTP